MTLVEFLRARVDEDEHWWRVVEERERSADVPTNHWLGRPLTTRMLADCKAKRRILGELENAERMAGKKWHRKIRPEVDEYLRSMTIAAYALACAYYPHPDFSSEWRQ